MKRIDFEHGSITSHIVASAFPMMVAQLLSLLYNIVDRIYIARIPNAGTTALGVAGSSPVRTAHIIFWCVSSAG